MMTIREYLDEIFDTEGFDAWDEADQALWEAYEDEEDDERFGRTCAELGIDLSDSEVVCAWTWDHCDY